MKVKELINKLQKLDANCDINTVGSNGYVLKIKKVILNKGILSKKHCFLELNDTKDCNLKELSKEELEKIKKDTKNHCYFIVTDTHPNFNF